MGPNFLKKEGGGVKIIIFAKIFKTANQAMLMYRIRKKMVSGGMGREDKK